MSDPTKKGEVVHNHADTDKGHIEATLNRSTGQVDLQMITPTGDVITFTNKDGQPMLSITNKDGKVVTPEGPVLMTSVISETRLYAKRGFSEGELGTLQSSLMRDIETLKINNHAQGRTVTP